MRFSDCGLANYIDEFYAKCKSLNGVSLDHLQS
jgi:hypothetical protein